MASPYYRFRPGAGWGAHLFKAAVRQDHAPWAATLAPYLPRDGIAIDVGAHGGQVTRLLARLAPDGMVVAVEPSGYARSILRPALWARRTRNVVVVAAGLGATPGIVLLRTPLKRRGEMGFGLATLGVPDRAAVAEPVAVVTLDALVTALALPRVDLIKADIEGFEDALIAGATATLRAHRPALLLEMSDPLLRRAGASLDGLWARLTASGYGPHGRAADGTLVPHAGPPADGDYVWLPA